MDKLIRGVETYQAKILPHQPQILSLAEGQAPRTLFIACSDSRIDPHLITQSVPGELFVVRTAGNLVPPHGWSNGGEAASIEYAVRALEVRQIVLCGHSHCGAMAGVVDPVKVAGLPRMRRWLRHAEETRFRVACAAPAEEARLGFTVEENVRVQVERLHAYPEVLRRVRAGSLSVHGWVYRLESGAVDSLDVRRGTFHPLGERPRRVA
jgi:carbonic anhydrase